MTLILESNKTRDGYDCADVSSENGTPEECVVQITNLTNLQNNPKADEPQIIQNPYYEDSNDTVDGTVRSFLQNRNSDIENVTVVENPYYE